MDYLGKARFGLQVHEVVFFTHLLSNVQLCWVSGALVFQTNVLEIHFSWTIRYKFKWKCGKICFWRPCLKNNVTYSFSKVNFWISCTFCAKKTPTRRAQACSCKFSMLYHYNRSKGRCTSETGTNKFRLRFCAIIILYTLYICALQFGE